MVTLQENHPARFSRGVISTRARVSLALLSVMKNGTTRSLVVMTDSKVGYQEPPYKTTSFTGAEKGVTLHSLNTYSCSHIMNLYS